MRGPAGPPVRLMGGLSQHCDGLAGTGERVIEVAGDGGRIPAGEAHGTSEEGGLRLDGEGGAFPGCGEVLAQGDEAEVLRGEHRLAAHPAQVGGLARFVDRLGNAGRRAFEDVGDIAVQGGGMGELMADGPACTCGGAAEARLRELSGERHQCAA